MGVGLSLKSTLVRSVVVIPNETVARWAARGVGRDRPFRAGRGIVVAYETYAARRSYR